MEYAQVHIASGIVGKSKTGSSGLRIAGYLTAQRGKWEITADIIQEKFDDMVLFVSQTLETSMSELWQMDYYSFLRLLNKADEIAQARLKQLEKAKK